MSLRMRLAAIVLAVSLFAVAVPAAFAQGEGGDKVVLNEAYTLEAGEILSGSLAIVGGRATLEPGSVVTGDVVLFGGALTAEGTIAGSVAAFGGHVSLGEAAVLEGDFASLGGALDQAPGAVIRGETLEGLRSIRFGGQGIRIPGMDVRPPFDGVKGGLEQFFFWQLRTFGAGLLLAILGVVALLVAPKGVGRITGAVAAQPAVSFGMGLLTLLLAMFAGGLLLIACGLGLLLWLALLLGLILGWVGAGLWVGQRLLAALNVRTSSSIPEAIAGIFVITVLAGLPFCIGFFIWLILDAIGLGAVVLTRFGTQDAEGGASA